MTENGIRTLPLDHAACYAAMRSHDTRFDGRFFCGVSSTRIYCRPICRVRLPKEENCAFFASAAAAEAAGYRPCLKCRPELAPGLAPADSAERLARSAAQIIEVDCLADRSISELADTLGVSDRHLRRVFFAEYGVSPVQYLQTRRLLLAKNLLTDTGLAVTEVAMAAGFGSIRRFNELFNKRYRLAPGRFRNGEGKTARESDAFTLSLAYRPPYAWKELIAFLASRAIPGVEYVTQDGYRRTVAIRKGESIHRGWISITHEPKRNSLSATVASSLLPVLPQVLARIRQLFDLDCDPCAVQEKLEMMDTVWPDIRVPGIRLPGCFDPFEIVVRAVLGQQITVKAALTLATRLAVSFGEKIEAPFEDLCCTFPLPERICSLDAPVEECMGPLGIIRSKARSILALAKALEAGEIALSSYADPHGEMKKLLRLPGLGPWTVQYIAMRALGWTDAFLDSDYGVRKALSSMPAKEAAALPQSLSPWRSYATITLWNALRKD